MTTTTNVTTLPMRPAFDLNDFRTLQLDLTTPRPKDVLAIAETFAAAIQSSPEVGPVPVTTGWNDISPEIAINLLKRNLPGANRKIDPATVYYYAQQMASGEWKATGQPILVDSAGRLQDAQHRLLAGLISGVTFKSFVVTDIEPIPGLFAYIDNARARTGATALQTAGFNGVAASIVRVIKIGEDVRHGVYNPTGSNKLPRMSPATILNLVHDYPNAQKAARSAASDWDEVVTYVGDRRDIVGYLGMRIMDLHGEEVADEFFEEVLDTNPDPDSPIAAFRKLVDKDNRDEKRMKRQHMLAAMIKVFNAWRTGEPLGRRWMLQVNENFPSIVGSQVETEEAA